MRTDQARTISIVAFLAREGHTPSHTRQNGREAWYRSPLRADDDTASFKVDTLINKWFDHGRGEGGNTLDLVVKLKQCTVREALAVLERSGLYQAGGYRARHNTLRSMPGSLSRAFQSPAIEKEKDGKAFQLIEAKDLTHPALLQYLASRGIALPVARRYLKEIRFKPANGELKEFFALGWFNGVSWEARNSLFKGVVGEGKDVSSINLKDGGECHVFEGFMDFLSFLTNESPDLKKSSFIILNSLALRSKLEDIFKAYNFKSVSLYLDHDESGRLGTDYLKSLEPDKTVDKAGLYIGFKDYNAWRMKKDKPGEPTH